MIYNVPTGLQISRACFSPTNIQSRWGCPDRDNILVENKLQEE